MAASNYVKRSLLAHSAGYCQNPDCHAYLIVFFDSGEISSFEEIAHIIAQSPTGPRGDQQVETNQVDIYENLLLLCPTCHTLVDKNPEQFPAEVLQAWKAEHVQKVKRVFEVPIFKNRGDLKAAIDPLMKENHQIFLSFGPHSDAALDPLSDAARMWRKLLRDQILPNNQSLDELFLANDHLLSEKEGNMVGKFRMHKAGLEYNHLSGDKNSAVPLFPKGLENILED